MTGSTLENLRMSHGRRSARYKDNSEVVANPDLTDEQLQKLKELEEGSMQAEVKYIDKKWTEQGQAYFAETVEEEIPEQINWWSQFALCIVRHWHDHTQKQVRKICLQVNSQHLKDLLKDTIQDFPGVSFATKEITIDKPYRCLFYYRHELEAAGNRLEEGSQESEHHRLLMDFINEEFKEAIAITENLLDQGMINFEHLWAIFRPGTTIYGPVFGQPRAFKLVNHQVSCQPPGLMLQTQYIDFDGDDMGTRSGTRFLPAFSGDVKINSLSAYPIEWHSDQESLQRTLISRGRRWEALAGMQFCNYTGVALDIQDCDIIRYHVNSRVVVDTKTFHRLNADQSWKVEALTSEEDRNQGKIQDGDDDVALEELDLVPNKPKKNVALTDEQCILASSMVRGFAFGEKRFLDFFVDKLSPAEWNSNCFDQLVLPPAQKDLVKALVADHVGQRHSFDDIVKGKGKGLVFVLHGPPGVGKTLTAETVAEYSQRPLYSVSSGDLGTESTLLDERLTRILDMASTWKAVLLIDEADIFLEARSLHDLQRNTLVSIFLRVLEYYEGILFLTSNRVATFDEAFKSRIHVPLKYNDLTADSRKKIWKNFLGNMGDAININDKGIERLAQAEVNGRQIKNIIRTAKSLAQFHGQALDEEKLSQVIGIQEEFEHELDLTNVVHVVNGKTGVNGH